MLKGSNRIKLKKDFDRIFRNGKSFNADFLFFKIAKNDLGRPRFGFVVSKKISKSSVVRNKIKRTLSEIVRKHLPDMQKGTDVVVVVKSNPRAELCKADSIISKAVKSSFLRKNKSNKYD